jgi:hypothetical protein
MRFVVVIPQFQVTVTTNFRDLTRCIRLLVCAYCLWEMALASASTYHSITRGTGKNYGKLMVRNLIQQLLRLPVELSTGPTLVLDRRGMKWKDIGENCIMRSFVTCTVR